MRSRHDGLREFVLLVLFDDRPKRNLFNGQLKISFVCIRFPYDNHEPLLRKTFKLFFEIAVAEWSPRSGVQP